MSTTTRTIIRRVPLLILTMSLWVALFALYSPRPTQPQWCVPEPASSLVTSGGTEEGPIPVPGRLPEPGFSVSGGASTDPDDAAFPHSLLGAETIVVEDHGSHDDARDIPAPGRLSEPQETLVIPDSGDSAERDSTPTQVRSTEPEVTCGIDWCASSIQYFLNGSDAEGR